MNESPSRLQELLSASAADPLLDLAFDHYQRYSLTKRLVDYLYPGRAKPLRILDVGGHSSSLKHFLPDDEIVILDIIPPPDYAHNQDIPFLHDGYFMGSGTDLPFAGGSFDIVTSHDTLEHVPEAGRSAFLHEMARVCRGHIILNGPVYHELTAGAEKRVFQFGKEALWWENPYLAEHIAEGLPSPALIRESFREAGVPFISIPNGSLPLWIAMMALRHYLLALPNPGRLQEVIDRVYNILVSPRDFGDLCYREAFVAAKRPADASGLESLAAGITGASLSGEEQMDILGLLLDALQEHAGSVRLEVAGLRESVQSRDARIAEVTASRDDHAAQLRMAWNMLARRESELATAEHELQETRAVYSAREYEFNAAREELAAIRGSAGYRLLEGFRRAMRLLFPPGSIRGIPYRAFVKLIRKTVLRLPALYRRLRSLAGRSRRLVKREGWRSFARKAARKVISRIKNRPVRPRAIAITYEQWIAANEPDAAELELQRKTASLLPARPLISLITPVWNPPLALLRETIASVTASTYDNWELCLVNGASADPEVRRILDEAAAHDSRIKVRHLDENKGISGNSNEAIAMAAGDFVAFLDHTDILAPNALWEVAVLINRNPAVDCVYSDHDLLSESGRRYEPLFKPEWSPEMLLSANFATHFCALRKELIDELGGLRGDLDGAQDWDLMLRVSEQTGCFSRIPKVLYHWRADSTSAVTSPDNKPYAVKAQDAALREHVERTGASAEVVREEHGWPRLKWHLTSQPKVSIIIPTRHNRKLLSKCLRSIARSSYTEWEVIVVDSADRNADREKWHAGMQTQVPYKLLWWQGPFNYSGANNLGAREASGEVLLFLNDDTEPLTSDWLEEMLGWLQQPEIGAVGARLVSPNGQIQHGGDILGLNGFADHLFTGCQPNEWTLAGSANWYRNFTAITGACLMTTRALFNDIGGFDENFMLCGSDVELCLRIRRRRLRIVCTPYAHVLHHERATRGTLDIGQDAFTSYWHYQSYLNGGYPYFSPNLSRFSSQPRLRHPDEPRPTAAVAPALGRNLTPYKQGAAKMEEEAAALVEWCQISPGEVEATKRLHEANAAPSEVRSINWFIPDFENPFYGGLHTILRFADHFKRNYGVQNRFIVLGTGPEPYVRSGIKAAFPSLEDSDIRFCSLAEEDIRSQPEADASIATLWVTAYALSKFPNTKRKFYMVQDFEPVFYPGGTLYALSEATYRLGLYGLCNTLTLRDIYQNEYGGKGFGFIPAVDTSLFHPPEGPRHPDDTLMVFLYGRPGHWRNCYELAIAALRRLKQRMKRKVRIVTAGSWVGSSDSESAYLVDNLGLLDYKETATLYRQCDAGLTLSVSKHPSYLPFELMASGAVVVSNYNPSGFWLLHNEENCLLAEPTAESLCAALERALTDDALRDRLAKQAVADIQANFADWPTQINNVYRYLCDPEGQTS